MPIQESTQRLEIEVLHTHTGQETGPIFLMRLEVFTSNEKNECGHHPSLLESTGENGKRADKEDCYQKKNPRPRISPLGDLWGRGE